jgi:hypothetical protein
VLDAQHIRQILAGEPVRVKVAEAPREPEQPSDEGERAEERETGGILPPPMTAPKPTS